jgi:parvulin-like peptidyl-prolyl isomerase
MALPLIVLLTGCGWLAAHPKPGKPVAAPATPAAPAGGEVAVLVNGEPIPRRDLDHRIQEYLTKIPSDVNARERAKMKANLPRISREDLIMEKVIEQAIRREGVAPSAAQVEAEVKRGDQALHERGASLEEYMKASGRSLDDVRRDIWFGFKPPTDDEARHFYDQNKRLYTRPEAAHVTEIMVAFPAGRKPTSRERDEIKAKAETLRGRVAYGEDFAAVARKDSGGPTAGEGGDLGWVIRHPRLSAPLVKACFSQKIGALGPVIESEHGYHILKVLERRSAKQIPFEEVRQSVADDCMSMQRAQKARALADKLRQQAKIVQP